MNAVYRTTSFADCLAVFLGIIVCFMLSGCGNKGDLYLENVELSAEQKALLNPDEAVDEVDQVDKEDKEDKEDEVTDPEKPKKKKTDESQTTE